MEMTAKNLAKVCKDAGYYRTPHLNEVLYFHFKGFCEITDAISEYVNARCLWIEGNAIAEIENLDKLTELRQIYFQDNCIRKITGLNNLTNLVTLNFTNNFINKIEGLEACSSLKSLILKNNRIKQLTDFEYILKLPHLETLDLTANNIEDEKALDIFAKCPSLLSLYIHQNPFVKKIKPYRKTVVGRCKKLKYLDDRPVFVDERRATNAFMENGIEGERSERALMREEERTKNEQNRLAFLALISNCKKEMAELHDQGLTQPPDTEFHIQNYGGDPTPEDKWFTEERARNARKSKEVQAMEKKALLQSLVEAKKEEEEEEEEETEGDGDKFLEALERTEIEHVDPMAATEVENDLVIEEVDDAVIDAADPTIPKSP
eukprot:TRINITY_DN5740_c0_g1_i1.p1 TRINITY_DN5740_c0_g1~~TRINITY_DN5740_c0_g1_i1.p1  ORF type:complete len:377 (+),score=96.48 TRINITY_DN5740_c0_g1_i1:135-1265(+)